MEQKKQISVKNYGTSMKDIPMEMESQLRIYEICFTMVNNFVLPLEKLFI